MQTLLKRIQSDGWATIDNIRSPKDFSDLATQLGEPIQLTDGSLIKTLTPKTSDEARPNTLSAIYGKGSFPFHTDTAFLPLPSRFVILRALEGDLRRPTLILPFQAAINKTCSPSRAIWTIKHKSCFTYATMHFNDGEKTGLRFDLDCMQPKNDSARAIALSIRNSSNSTEIKTCNWVSNRVLIIDNWTMLHARGPEPENEGKRVLERIYIKSL